MQRLAITLSTLALIFVMLVNAAVFYQNLELRRRAAVSTPQPTQAVASTDQSAKIAELEQQLKRADQDRVKATRDAANARGQFDQLQTAAHERDTLKTQAQTLAKENAQLRAQVGNLQTMNTINGQVAPLRGLPALSQVPRTFMNHDQLRTYFTDMLAKEWPPAQEQRQAAIMRAFEMGPANADLRQNEIDSMVKDILGFYDHDSKQLVVVTDRAQMGVRDRVTYAHEFTHSLQDQHYNLTRLFDQADDNSDYSLALRALVEGDATLTMGLYASQNLTAMDAANLQLEEFQSLDLSGIAFGAGGPLTESATYFPYREGAEFVSMLYQNGGWK